jgi:hypothetical protein
VLIPVSDVDQAKKSGLTSAAPGHGRR